MHGYFQLLYAHAPVFRQRRGQKLARARLPEGRGLIITGGTSTTRLGYVAKVQDALAEAGHDTLVYNKVQPNPTIEGVRECAALCRAENIAFVVGLGGGSSIDTAKAVAIMATNDGDWWDYIHGGTGGGKRIAKAGLPIVAIPTTAGTGTEADPFTVITNGEEKIGGGGEKCFPTISIVDPDFMMTVPPHLTAYQGFDAFFHAAEGYLAKTATPISEMFSLKAIELIGRSLATAVHEGGDTQARADVALANTLAGFVETLSSCTGEHAIEHALSAYHPALPHGAGLIMISKAYWSRFFESSGDQSGCNIARALGQQGRARARGLHRRARHAAEALQCARPAPVRLRRPAGGLRQDRGQRVRHYGRPVPRRPAAAHARGCDRDFGGQLQMIFDWKRCALPIEIGTHRVQTRMRPKLQQSSATGETFFRTCIKSQAHVLPFYEIRPPHGRISVECAPNGAGL